MPVIKSFLIVLVFCLLFTFSVKAQDSNYGKVTEIVDGRTMVITTTAGDKFNFLLFYIEVPEPEQELSQLVKTHLERLVLNKEVKLVSESKYSQGFLGTIYLGDIDISQQMLRDGAAWYNLPEQSNASSRNEYQQMESLAKSEKLGIWGVQGLKPAWEFRTERFAKKIEEQKNVKSAIQKTTLVPVDLMWADIPTSQTKKTNNQAQDVEEEELETGKTTVRITVKGQSSPRPKINPTYEKTVEAVEEMQSILQDLSGEGISSLSSYRYKLGKVKVKVAVATDALEKGKLKYLMQENIEILDDLDLVIGFIDGRDIDGIYYRGDAVKISEKYFITPVRAKSGDFVLMRQDILNAMIEKTMRNFLEIKKMIE